VRRRHQPSHAPETDPDAAAPRPDVEVPAETGTEPADAPHEHEFTPAAPEAIETKEGPVAVSDDSQVSVVSRGTKIEGSVIAAGSLRVEGEVRGEITAQGEVSLSPDGRVEANIKAGSITLAGTVKGDLDASGDVALPAESRLEGNIRARNADVGGIVQGDVTVNGRASLGPRARVEGDITSSALVIAEGAVFIGRSVMNDRA